MNPAWTLQRRSKLVLSVAAAVYAGMRTHTHTRTHAQNWGFPLFVVFDFQLLQSTASKENVIPPRNLKVKKVALQIFTHKGEKNVNSGTPRLPQRDCLYNPRLKSSHVIKKL